MDLIGNSKICEAQIFGGARAVLFGDLDQHTTTLLAEKGITELVIGVGYGPSAEVIVEDNLEKAIKYAREEEANFNVDLTRLVGISSLKYLSLNLPVSSGLESIEKLPRLERLELGYPIESQIDFTKMKSLKLISLDNCTGSEKVFECEWLEHVILWHLQAEDLRFMRHLKSMVTVEIRSSTIRSLFGISEKLRSLTLYQVPNLENFDYLFSCEELEFLRITHCRKIRSLSRFEELRKLEHLSLYACGEIDSLEPLKTLPLKKLELNGMTKIMDGNTAVLLNFTDLDAVSFYDMRHYNMTQNDYYLAKKKRK